MDDVQRPRTFKNIQVNKNKNKNIRHIVLPELEYEVILNESQADALPCDHTEGLLTARGPQN